VNASGLKRLVGFLNLSPEDLETWEAWKRDGKRDRFDGSEKMFTLMSLIYMTGLRDTSETLAKLQQDLSSDILGLLNSDKPVEAALGELLDRIDELKLAGSKKVLKPTEGEKKPFTVIDIVRVSPPVGKQQGRRAPTVNRVAVGEYEYDDSAREAFYRIVDHALRNNTISEIRNCLFCEKFFLRDGRRLTYCSPSCETKFNNQRRIEAGYFKDRRNPVEDEEKSVSRSPEAYLKRLIRAEDADRDGKLLPIYRKLGGPQDGRKFIRRLKGKPWGDLAPEARKKIAGLSAQYPLEPAPNKKGPAVSD
jgi:hypothetical protein